MDVVLSEEITAQLLKKRVIKKNESYEAFFWDRFKLNDGTKPCFAFGLGYFKEELPANKSNSDSQSNDKQIDDSNNSIIKKEKIKSMMIYGNDLTLYLNIIKQGENEIIVANKIIVGKVKNTPSMFLGYGEIRFVKEAAYISNKVKNILAETSKYLKVWESYAKHEGKGLLRSARDIGELTTSSITPNSTGYTLNLTNNSVLQKLKCGDYLTFSNELPVYLENEGISWDEYREYQNAQKSKQNKPESFEIGRINIATNSLTILGDIPLNYKYIFLAIGGEAKQIERREDARNCITEGLSAMPTLGLILEGNNSTSSSITDLPSRKISNVPPLSAFVKEKVFKNEPTNTQVNAIDIALNTPDIAVIQGPPGTGKTTIITAIVERLNEIFDKRESIKGQILITSFQHDAVENVIQRLKINSLPTIKFGKRNNSNESDSQIDNIIDEWSIHAAEKIRNKNLSINDLEEVNKFNRAFEFYELAPNDNNLKDFLKKAKNVALSDEHCQAIDYIYESLQITNSANTQKLLNLVQKIRTTTSGFMDDGSETSMALYDTLETIMDQNDKNNMEILEVLRSAAMTDGIPSKNLLKQLRKIREDLSYKLIPKPYFKIEIPRSDVIELYNNIKKSLRKPQNQADAIVLDFLAELENNPLAVNKALSDYSFVYSASTQQSVGKDIKNAKNKDITYDTVIVDEAARANPGDLMIPLTQAKRRIILVGDHRQLPHIYDDEIVESLQENDSDFSFENIEKTIEKTMFEQLMESAQKLESSDGIRRTITLDAQYRMHPLLGEFVDENFYKAYGEGFSSPLNETYFKQSFYDSPAVWINVPNSMGREDKSGTSRIRRAEVSVIVDKIKEMINTAEGEKLSFGVISFYSAQVTAIKNLLGEELRKKVRVGSVDAFQGMEFDVIFLSTVRTSKHEEIKSNIATPEKLGIRLYGFMTSENRLCVAMSRQKRLLIAVGDYTHFSSEVAKNHVPAMFNYYNLCKENGGVFDV